MDIFPIPLQAAPAAPVRPALAPGVTEGSGLQEPDALMSSATRAGAFDALLAEELAHRSAPAEPADHGTTAAIPAIGAAELASAHLVLPPPALYAQSAVSALAQDGLHARSDGAVEDVPAPQRAEPTDPAPPHTQAVANGREPLPGPHSTRTAESAGRYAGDRAHAPENVTRTVGPAAATAAAASMESTRSVPFPGAQKNVSHVRDGEAFPAEALRLAQPGEPIRVAVQAPAAAPALSAHDTPSLAATRPELGQAVVSPGRESAAAVQVAPSDDGPEGAPARRDLAAAAPGVVRSGLGHEPAREPWGADAASRASATSMTAPLPTAAPHVADSPFSPTPAAESMPPVTLLASERNAEAGASLARKLSTGQLIPQSGAAVTPAVTNAAATTEAPAATRLETPFATQSWGNAFAGRIAWLAGQGEQVARLHLNPPELGPVAVTLHVSAEEASARFVAAHAAVREAIEAALPRLRDMLAENGISLGETEVSGESSGQHAAREESRRLGEAGARLQSVSAPASGERAARAGLVDTYA